LRLLIATHNVGKLREYELLLDGLGLSLMSLADLDITMHVEESAATFKGNAALKARAYARISGLLTLADDSGLEVDALGGEPGVHSARYGGAMSDVERYRLLLQRLEGVQDSRRGARFRCVIAVVTPEGELHTSEGVCEGRIAHRPRGTHGFGYDPVFHLPQYGCTMAELHPETKNRVSHRAQAARGAREILGQMRSGRATSDQRAAHAADPMEGNKA
jgi:XTP/dITP diphosphohydrolase